MTAYAGQDRNTYTELRQLRPRSLLKKAAGPGVFAGFAFDELG